MTDIVDLEYKPNHDYGLQSISHALVDLPNQEQIRVVSEFTKYGNRFTAYPDGEKLCFVKSSGNLSIHFRTLGGFQVMDFAEK